MKAQCLNIISMDNYPTKRVADGLLLILPLKGITEIQHFITDIEVENDLFIINNSEIFTIKSNEKAIKLYIASDWFYDRGYDFFAYQYTSNLIQSSNALFQSILNLTQRQLNQTLTEVLFESYMNDIVDIIASEAKVDIKYLKQQTDYSFYGITGEMLDYVNNHLDKKLTLKEIANKLFISQSNISSQFYNTLGMSFKTYIDTLKLSTSISTLLTGKSTISEVSDQYGFSSSASYSKKFKHYFGHSPKDYRMLSKLDKSFPFTAEDYTASSIVEIQNIITERLNKLNVQNNYICIDLQHINESTNDTIVIQIHSIKEFHNLFASKSMSYLFEGTQKVIVYCMIEPRKLQETFMDEAYGFINFVYHANVNLAFQITNSNDVNIYIDQIYSQYQTYLQAHPELSEKHMHSVSYIFNAETMPIKEIYRNIIKIQQYREHVKFGIDITHLFNNPECFKLMEKQMKRIGFDYFFVDNHKLTSPYLSEDHEDLLTKQVFKFSNIRKIMNDMELEERSYFLLNVHNNYLLNDDNMEIIESPPLLMGMFKQIREHFTGVGIDLFQQQDEKNALYLYDKKGFRSVLGNMYERIMEKMRYKVKDFEYYTIVNQPKKISIFVNDWRIGESETAEYEPQNVQIHLNFKDKAMKRPYIVFYEKINSTFGNINGIIAPSLRIEHAWSDELVSKIDDYNKPHFTVIQHHFEEENLTIDLNYNTVHIIDIYKS